MCISTREAETNWFCKGVDEKREKMKILRGRK
jgi:hypothetical protein